MTKISELTDTKFDGVNHPYVPPKQLTISPQAQAASRRRRATSTRSRSRSSATISGTSTRSTAPPSSASRARRWRCTRSTSTRRSSPRMPSSSIFGPYMQYMSGVTDTQVKWILENRSDNPGIRDGDMFLANDPWVGAAHQHGRDADLPGVLGGRAVLLGDQLPAPIRHRRHHAGQLLPSAPRRVRRGHPHPAGEDRREATRSAATSRSSICARRASPSWWRSISAPRWPATSRRASACCS